MSNYDEFLSSVDDVNQDAVEEHGNRYPLIQWVKGDQKAKKAGGFDYHGGWFVAEDRCDLSGVEGWEKVEWVRNDGSSVEGFYASNLHFSVLNHREWWEVTDDAGSKTRFGWNSYKEAAATGNARGRNQYLVAIKGMEDRGIFLVSLLGKAGEAFGSQRGALAKLSKVVVSKANDFLRSKRDNRKMPFYSFWLNVGYNRDEKGNPVFEIVGKGKNTSTVCLPMAWDFPTGEEKVDFLTYYVGKELNAKFGEFFKESQEWAAQTDKIVSGVGDAQSSSATHTAAKVDDLADKAAEYGI